MVKEKTLVPVETYLESGIQVGTKFKTKFMQQYIHKVNPKNGVAILDLEKVDLDLGLQKKLILILAFRKK